MQGQSCDHRVRMVSGLQFLWEVVEIWPLDECLSHLTRKLQHLTSDYFLLLFYSVLCDIGLIFSPCRLSWRLYYDYLWLLNLPILDVLYLFLSFIGQSGLVEGIDGHVRLLAEFRVGLSSPEEGAASHRNKLYQRPQQQLIPSNHNQPIINTQPHPTTKKPTPKNNCQESSPSFYQNPYKHVVLWDATIKEEHDRNVKIEEGEQSFGTSFNQGSQFDQDGLEFQFQFLEDGQTQQENGLSNEGESLPGGESSDGELKLSLVTPCTITEKSMQIDSILANRCRKRKKNRKIRTTITREKLALMNEIFADYMKQKEQGKNPRYNLKEIGNQLGLGYSTILHKFREFRSAKIVRGGALIASLQKKRKYRKSIHIQRTIEQALQKQSFYTAVELSEYIYRETKKKFSRSIISRHLGEMGYSYKNLKISPIQKNKPKYKQNRRIYASILLPFIHNNHIMVYIDEFALSVSTFMKKKNVTSSFDKFENTEEDYVSVIAAASIEGVLNYSIKHGFYTRGEFCQCIVNSFKTVKGMRNHSRYFQVPEKAYLITDMHRIHLDPEGEHDEKPINAVLTQLQAQRIFLPPASPQLNPLDSIFTNLKHRLQKRDIRTQTDLLQLMHKNMLQISKEPTQIYFSDVLTALQKSRLQENI